MFTENPQRKSLRILMIAPQPFFEPRGTPISVYQRLVGLSELGHQIELVTYHLGEGVEIDNVTIHRIPDVPFIKSVKIGPSFTKPWLDILLILTTLWILLRNRFDVLHTHEEASYFGVLFSKIFQIPHVYDMHSSLPRQLENFNYGWRPLVWLFEHLERWVLMTSDFIITIGEDLEALVKQINPNAKVSTIENIPFNYENIETDAGRNGDLDGNLSIDNYQPLIIYTGTFEAYQGIDLLLRSAQMVSQTNPDARFVLVGGKPEQVAYWKSEASHLGLNDIITFTGVVSPREAATYMSLASILVSARTEGTSVPLKVYSYMNAGKPIIATRILAHTQVLNDDVALLVEPSSEALAIGIQELVRHHALRERLSRNAKELADRNYNFPLFITKLGQIYPSPSPPKVKPGELFEQALLRSNGSKVI